MPITANMTGKLNFNLRLPIALHKALQKAAKESGRSIHQEVLHRLAATFGKQGVHLVPPDYVTLLKMWNEKNL